MPRLRKMFRKSINHNKNTAKLKAKLGNLLKEKSLQVKKQQFDVIKNATQKDAKSPSVSINGGKKKSNTSNNDYSAHQVQVNIESMQCNYKNAQTPASASCKSSQNSVNKRQTHGSYKKIKMSSQSPEVLFSDPINQQQFENEQINQDYDSQQSIENSSYVVNSSSEKSVDDDGSDEFSYNSSDDSEVHSEYWEGETTCSSSDAVYYGEEANSADDYISVDDVENWDGEFNSSEDNFTNHLYRNIFCNDVNDSCSDDDYRLPPTELEDVIIHKGLAQKRDLRDDDIVSFDSDVEEAQIIELKSVQVKTIEQPKAYKKDELQKLNSKITTYSDGKVLVQPTEKEQTEPNSVNSDTCPKLTSILENRENTNNGVTEDWDSELEENFDDDSWNLIDKYQIHINKNSTSYDDYEMTQQEKEAIFNRSQMFIVNARDNLPQIDDYPLKLFNEMEHSQTDEKAYSILDQVANSVNGENKGGECSILTASVMCDSITETNKDVERYDHKPEQIVDDDSNDAVIFEEDSAVFSDNSLKTMPTELSNSWQIKDDMNALNCNKNLFCNAINDYEVLVLIREPFHIYGTVRLTVVLGAPQIYGYIPKVNEEVEIFSLRGCTTIGIDVLPHTYNDINNKNQEQNSQKLKKLLEKIFEKYRNRYVEGHLKILLNSFQPQTDAIVVLSRNVIRKRLQQQFHKCMDQNVFPNMKNLNIERPLYDSEYRLRCIINMSLADTKSLKIPMQWQHFTLNEKSKVLVAGGKAVGKSTLLRYLVNKYLSEHKSILYIDLDIGQPEIFVPQTISCCLLQQPLIGPGFMLNLQPDKSYAVGHTNIIMCPHRYVSSVKELINFCNNHLLYQNIPWLINTMGYNKGFGLELLSVITDDLNLTDLIQIQSTKEINNYDCLLYPSNLCNVTRQMFPDIVQSSDNSDGDTVQKINKRGEYALHIWQSVVNDESSRHNKEWDMSAKDLRYANLLSRISSTLTDTCEWITDCKPLKACLNDLKLINLQEYVNYKEHQLISAFEANLVYLCHYESSVLPLQCFGIGVIRAVDYTLNEVYLVPSAPLASLIHVNCLAIGEMPLPTALFINQGSKVLETAPFVYNTLDAKTSKAIQHFCRR